ncbi:MAG TPA: adenine phosphoribosyltransferase [Acidobacteriota bacterium]|nr:adenine phosphoribosyltransferase [Acidobacteriota bacterium]HQF87577.1 adenine phosphoribosyltransferase [Acidobacteriota bacterium]HQG92582.1 adenine phosphoribosyltransferase [Acidobacteriota bacterium]HQK86595.1 adenine phosphoribosyltransferase [Acidobacteriota bacterium]
MEALKQIVREIPDFPKPGILFYDITTLLRDAKGFAEVIDIFARHYRDQKLDAVVGVEARGFIFAAAVANRLGLGFIPVRKPGKLPYRTVSQSYQLEYGTDTLEMHADAVRRGDRILLIDDLMATGGTARAVAEMVGGQGGEVAGMGFVIELEFLSGRKSLPEYEIFSILKYQK